MWKVPLCSNVAANIISWFAVPGLEQYWGKDIFLSEVLTIEAEKALDKARQYNQPFFLYMAHYAIHDPEDIKVVDLDEICREQQVHDGCFATLDEVPKNALTLTIPMLTSGQKLFCIVPAKTKAWAVSHTLNDEISERIPATCKGKISCACFGCS